MIILILSMLTAGWLACVIVNIAVAVYIKIE